MSNLHDPAVPALCRALGDELHGLGALAEALAVVIVGDRPLDEKLIEHLQAFDRLAQLAHDGADILVRLAQGSSPAQAVEQVRLELLQERLHAALKAA